MSWKPVAEQLIRTRQDALVGYAYLLTRSHAEAEDLVQDALVRTFARSIDFPSVGHAEAYVRRAIATRFVDQHRSRQSERARAERLHGDDAMAGPDATVPGALDAAAALTHLPPRQRACVALRFLADQSIAETASALGLSEGAVKRYVSDGIATLNALLGTVTSSHDDLAEVHTKGGAR